MCCCLVRMRAVLDAEDWSGLTAHSVRRRTGGTGGFDDTERQMEDWRGWRGLTAARDVRRRTGGTEGA